jgi:hypothetical protein
MGGRVAAANWIADDGCEVTASGATESPSLGGVVVDRAISACVP